MSQDDVKLIAEKLDVLTTRVGTLEEAVRLLMTRMARHDRILAWLKMTGLLLLGAAVGSGLIRFHDVTGLLVTP